MRSTKVLNTTPGVMESRGLVREAWRRQKSRFSQGWANVPAKFHRIARLRAALFDWLREIHAFGVKKARNMGVISRRKAGFSGKFRLA